MRIWLSKCIACHVSEPTMWPHLYMIPGINTVSHLSCASVLSPINDAAQMPEHNKVRHGDFNPSNNIITEDGTPAS